jgi:hypothetical protein
MNDRFFEACDQRELDDYSIAQLGAVKERTVALWRKNKCRPLKVRRFRLADALRIPVDELWPRRRKQRYS